MVNIALIPLIIPQFEKVELKPLYVCPGCSNHTYSNNMITGCNVRLNRVNISYIMVCLSKKDYIIVAEI
jgi:hypothetical protein